MATAWNYRNLRFTEDSIPWPAGDSAQLPNQLALCHVGTKAAVVWDIAPCMLLVNCHQLTVLEDIKNMWSQ
jgi:hypothetical protein